MSSLLGCRKDLPPPKDVCIGDGFGGSDCVLKDGSIAYRSPSEMRNMWCTPQEDMKNFAAWCYKTKADRIEGEMLKVQMQIEANRPR